VTVSATPHSALGFRDYLLGRKHDLASSRRPSWPFIVHILANPDLPPVTTLPDLLRHLREAGVSAEVEQSAIAAWKSFSAYKCRHRAKSATPRLIWDPGGMMVERVKGSEPRA